MKFRRAAFCAGAALAFAPAVVLAQTKVSNLPAASAVSSTDVFPASQGCTGSPPAAACAATAGVTGAQLKTFAQSGLSASSLSNGVTGSGAVVLATSPALATPQLGVAKATTLAGLAITSITAGATAQIGTGGAAVCATSHVCDSLSGEITLTTGTGSLTAGTLFMVNFANTRTNIPNCVVVGRLATAGVGSQTLLMTPTTGTLAVASATSGLAASTVFTYDYICSGS